MIIVPGVMVGALWIQFAYNYQMGLSESVLFVAAGIIAGLLFGSFLVILAWLGDVSGFWVWIGLDGIAHRPESRRKLRNAVLFF